MTSRPNPILTPGKWSDTHSVRNVTSAEKSVVFKRYGIGLLRRVFYTIDHLVPLELNGTNDLENLWPQPRLEARMKDKDENRLAAAVASGQLSFEAARVQILRLWGPVIPVAQPKTIPTQAAPPVSEVAPLLPVELPDEPPAHHQV